MRIVVYSKVRLFCEALAGWLRSIAPDDDVRAVCRAEGLAEALDDYRPDAVLFDIHGDKSLRDAQAITAQFPDIHMLAIALPEISERVIACIDAGFNGYFPRDASLEDLYPTIERMLQGECRCSPQLAVRIFKELRNRSRSQVQIQIDELTKRESEVLELLGHGMCNKEIARQLDISAATVKNHLHHVFRKLQVSGRVQAIAKLREAPWLARSA